MNFKKQLFLFMLILSCFLGYSQNTKLPESLRMRLINPPEGLLISEYRELLTYNVIELDTINKWKYYMTKSSFHLYMGKDSVINLLEQAKRIKPKSTCRVLLSADDMYTELIQKGRYDKTFTWYLWELPGFNVPEFRLFCKDYYTSPKERRNDEKSPLELLISTRDQKYRIEKTIDIDWPKQDLLDLKNRELMDSIYTNQGTLEIFNNFELDQFSMVIHHSKDMEWNMKWFEIFFCEKLKNKKFVGGKYLGLAIRRFFHPNNMHTSDNPLRDKIYIDYLKLKYPTIAKKNNFNNY